MSSNYNDLINLYDEISLLSSISAVLNWDSETTLPFGGLEHRSKQYQYLGKKQHELWLNPTIGTLLDAVEKDETLDHLQRRNVELMRREYNSRA
ncbi:MAG: hypothetical protein ACXAC2_08605, partial [Candidatus Kariarchaeaceae archaeon]